MVLMKKEHIQKYNERARENSYFGNRLRNYAIPSTSPRRMARNIPEQFLINSLINAPAKADISSSKNISVHWCSSLLPLRERRPT